MSSYRVGLSSNVNRPQTNNGLKGLKSAAVFAKNTAADVGQVKQENRKPSLPALSITTPFEGSICASSSPLTTEKATQDVIKTDNGSQTSLSLPARPVRVAIPGTTLEEAEQSAEYWRQLHESMEVSLGEAMDAKREADALMEHHTQRLNDSVHRLAELREVVTEMGLDAEELENADDGLFEYTGEIYRKIYEESESE